jgi:AraC-like DNA-binding protein
MNTLNNPAEDWVLSAREARFQASRLAVMKRVSVRQLERLFEEIFNCCPQHWLNEVRFLQAALLLIKGHRVKEVAASLSFPHVAHFSNRFKEFFGCTPSDFVRIHYERVSERKRLFEGWYPGEHIPPEWLNDPVVLRYRGILECRIRPLREKPHSRPESN